MQTAKDLIELCKDKHVTVSSCESLTAGLFYQYACFYTGS